MNYCNLPETNIVSENRSGPQKTKNQSSNHEFSGATNAVRFREGNDSCRLYRMAFQTVFVTLTPHERPKAGLRLAHGVGEIIHLMDLQKKIHVLPSGKLT